MKTKIIHNKLGSYNFCNPSEKEESYWLIFDVTDREHKTVSFDYREEDAPQLDVNDYPTVNHLIDELEGYKSKQYLFSSSRNHIGEKTHEERIKIAREWAEQNAEDDYLEAARVAKEKADKLQEKAEKLRQDAVRYQAIALEVRLEKV